MLVFRRTNLLYKSKSLFSVVAPKHLAFQTIECRINGSQLYRNNMLEIVIIDTMPIQTVYFGINVLSIGH